MKYDFGAIESRWQHYWAENGTFKTANPGERGFDPSKPKYYVLDMFPYPSGAGLHVGHPLGYIATDIVARYKRMRGFAVLHPMGYDAFGLPAEQFAVEHGIHPRITTETNIANMTRQLKRLGLSYDWDRCLATTDPGYYRWTQWIFLQMYHSWFDPSQKRARPIADLVHLLETERIYVGPEGELVWGSAPDLDLLGGPPVGVRKWYELSAEERRGFIDGQRLAYLAEVPVNWCPALGTVLANEEITNEGRSERGNHPVFRRPLKQWMLRITAYAERLLEDLELVDWPLAIKLMQRNWIGRSEGAEVRFAIEGSDESVLVYTTRPDTLFGATYLVLAPEHPLVEAVTCGERRGVVAEYRRKAESETEAERRAEARAKTGVFTGGYAINPVNGERLPIWIADYVMMGYGTGAIMAVPAHDDRDFEFARQFGLPIREVVHTPPLAAMQGFCLQFDRDGESPHKSFEMLVDFVGLCMNQSRTDYDRVWTTINTQRKQEDPSMVGLSARGSISSIWNEALGPTVGQRINEFIEAGRRGRLIEFLGAAVTDEGFNINSANEEVSLDGLATDEAKGVITRWLEKKGLGRRRVNYKLRDWLFSRQRYWGEPFPILHGPRGEVVPLDESELPLELPPMDDFKPRASGDPSAAPQPPLARAPEAWRVVEWNGERYQRELNTMPQWAGSCWYYLRFCDPHNSERLVGAEAERYWMGGKGGKAGKGEPHAGGVDLYVGGAEHAVLHLLYARFWHKVLYDLGWVSTPEPFGRLFNQGYIQAYAYSDKRGVYVPAEEVEEKGGKYFYRGEEVLQEFGKMGKSLKNTVAPDDVCERYGCDTLRLYEMYLGPLDQSKIWRTRDIIGIHRFLHRLWRNLVDEQTGRVRIGEDPPEEKLRRLLHRTIKKVTEDMERLSFNTAIAALIELNSELVPLPTVPRQVAEGLVLCLSPMAPHVCEELWGMLGHRGSLAYEPWPSYDPAMLIEEDVEYPVQINGKLRCRIKVPAEASDEAIQQAALADEKVKAATEGKRVQKVIVARGRMVNVVLKG